MKPSSLDMVRSIEHSLDAYIEPELQAPLAVSAAAGMRNLLRHLAIRIENEPELLHSDNLDKRAVFGEVASMLRANGHAMAESDLAQLVIELETSSNGEARSQGEFPTLGSLSSENLELKDLADRTLRELHTHEEVIGKDNCESILAPIRSQLARQIERETACFDLSYTGPIF